MACAVVVAALLGRVMAHPFCCGVLRGTMRRMIGHLLVLCLSGLRGGGNGRGHELKHQRHDQDQKARWPQDRLADDLMSIAAHGKSMQVECGAFKSEFREPQAARALIHVRIHSAIR